MKKAKHYVDARRSVPFDTSEAARWYAEESPPVLERHESAGRVTYFELSRLDSHWDEESGSPAIGFC